MYSVYNFIFLSDFNLKIAILTFVVYFNKSEMFFPFTEIKMK